MGEITTSSVLPVHSDTLSMCLKPYVLPETPAVVTVGRRCMKDGFSFSWPAGESPFFTRPDGRKVTLHVDNFVPYIIERATAMTATTGSVGTPNPAVSKGKPRDIKIPSLKSSDLWVQLRELPYCLPSCLPRVDPVIGGDLWTETPELWIRTHRDARTDTMSPYSSGRHGPRPNSLTSDRFSLIMDGKKIVRIVKDEWSSPHAEKKCLPSCGRPWIGRTVFVKGDPLAEVVLSQHASKALPTIQGVAHRRTIPPLRALTRSHHRHRTPKPPVGTPG